MLDHATLCCLDVRHLLHRSLVLLEVKLGDAILVLLRTTQQLHEHKQPSLKCERSNDSHMLSSWYMTQCKADAAIVHSLHVATQCGVAVRFAEVADTAVAMMAEQVRLFIDEGT